MTRFREQLREQRWDDHRYYHHSLVNQSLHFISACTFLFAYVLVWKDPVLAALLGWGVAMTSRQAGHFFFEPRGYDHVNGCSDEYKEEIKVGYNIARKVVLMGLWAFSPLLLLANPSLFGLFEPHATIEQYARHVGLLWLALAGAGITVRVLQLWAKRDLETGLIWATKIITDPFSDFLLYHRAPGKLAKQGLAWRPARMR
jgi:hypothetical protein